MRPTMWILCFVTLFCIVEPKSADTENNGYNEFKEARKIVDEKIAQMDVHDLAVFRDEISVCSDRLDITEIISGALTEIQHACLNLRNFDTCINGVTNNFFGYDIHTLAKIFWDDPVFGKRAQSFTSKYKQFQQVCTEDTAVFREEHTTENEDIKQCMKILDIEKFLAGKYLKIDDVCPRVHNYLNCLDKAVEKALGVDMVIVAKIYPDTTEMGKYSRVYMKLKRILHNVCPKKPLYEDDINEDIQECLKMLDIENVYDENSEKLEGLCPNLLNYGNCLEDYIKERTGHDVVFLEKLLSDTKSGNSLKVFTNLRNLAQEFCSKDSDLYRDYKMDEECFERVYLGDMYLCKKDSKVVYERFSKMMNYKYKENTECVENGYLLTCLGVEIHEKCGKRAFNTYSEAIKKSDILRLKYCSETAFEDFKTSFLESLNMNADRQELFRQIFNPLLHGVHSSGQKLTFFFSISNAFIVLVSVAFYSVLFML